MEIIASSFASSFLKFGPRIAIALALSTFAFTAPKAFAQRVDETRGEKVRIAPDGLKFQNAQAWEAIDGNGEVVGWIEITQTKEPWAYGVIRGGHAVKGANLRLKEDRRITNASDDIGRRKWFIGPSFMQSNVTSVSNNIEVKLSGTQWGLQLGFDQVLSPRQLLRLRLGNDLISAQGDTSESSICDGDLQCKLWIHYLTASLGFVFQIRPEGSIWNAGISTGFAGFLPVSRESDVMNTTKISMDGGFEAGIFASVKTNPITWLEFSTQQVFLRETSLSRYKLIRYNINWVQNF